MNLAELVERFERNRASYQAAHYNETQLRREFLDPLFKALGWDIDNERGHAEAYKDVIHEDAIKVGGATKAVELRRAEAGGVLFKLGATHHGFDADASDIGGELEQMIGCIRKNFPENQHD